MRRFFIILAFCFSAISSFGQYVFGVKYFPKAIMNSEETKVYSFDFGYTNKFTENSIFTGETLLGFDYYNNEIKSGNFTALFFLPYVWNLRHKKGITFSPGIALGLVVDGTPNYTFVFTPQISLIIPINKAEEWESHQYLDLKAGYEISTNTALLNKGFFARLGMDFW